MELMEFNKDRGHMNNLRTFLASLRFSGSRFDSYYGSVIHQGTGYPTADEARRDVALRERSMQIAGVSLNR